jgi:hypothetical protein
MSLTEPPQSLSAPAGWAGAASNWYSDQKTPSVCQLKVRQNTIEAAKGLGDRCSRVREKTRIGLVSGTKYKISGVQFLLEKGLEPLREAHGSIGS